MTRWQRTLIKMYKFIYHAAEWHTDCERVILDMRILKEMNE